MYESIPEGIVGAFVDPGRPVLHILLAGRAPTIEELRFQRRGRLYVAVSDGGLVRSYIEAPDGTGSVWITMRTDAESASKVRLERPKACRAGLVNSYPHQAQIVDVRLGEDDGVVPKGRAWTEGWAVPVEIARMLCARFAPDWDLLELQQGREITWLPTLRLHPNATSKQRAARYKRACIEARLLRARHR